MQREEALSHFTEQYVKPTFDEQIKKLAADLRKNKDRLAGEFLTNFQQFCAVIYNNQQNTAKEPIAYMQFSLLRTSFLENKATYRWDGYNQNWYADNTPCRHSYDAGWAMRYLEQPLQELELIRKTYVNQIYTQDMAKIKQYYLGFFHKYVLQLARYALRRPEAAPEFGLIQKERPFIIMAGEFYDACRSIYLEDDQLVDIKQIKRQLKRNPQHCYRDLRNIDLSSEEYPGIDLSYSHLRQCACRQSNFKNAMLVGTDFSNSNLQEADFSYSCLADADFQNCRLQSAKFTGANSGYDIDIDKNLSFFGANFQNSDLTQTDFTGADLRGADFRGAVLLETNFFDSLLKDAVFLEQDKPKLNLALEQIQGICWV